MNAEILLTLKLQGHLFADPKRITLLKQIDNTGSISQGAKQAGISYKSAWDAVNEMNQLTDSLLVERATGGKGGGGAHLTSYGKRLLQLYGLLEKIQQKAFDALQDDDIPLDSLLGAIARFSLQTSARNQFFSTVLPAETSAPPGYVRVLLADGKTSLYASLTNQSIKRLGLVQGKEVLALIKAPLIELHSAEVKGADNCLPGRVASITEGEQRVEVLLTLDGGETMCSTVSYPQAKTLGLTEGQSLWATFQAESVIIATLC